MKLIKYLKDLVYSIIIFIISYLIVLLMLLVFKTSISLIISVSFIIIMSFISIILINYYRKKKFYDEFINNLNKLDKKYLILETLNKPEFYEGNILYNSLYDINKSMLEEVNDYSSNINDFKEYVEMWIHEVKIPISSLVLMCHNNSNIDKKFLKQIKKLNNYIDQVLYYVRSNYTEEDFLIKKVNLDKIVSNVLLNNKDDILENNIELDINIKNIEVYTDSKWLEFIINQIINNCIKYKKQDNSIIRITGTSLNNKAVLSIWDNGIGIQKSDLPKVFNKSFTGNNGRGSTKSTGMGLYITKKLCDKLGHKIEIDSIKGKYTNINIIFGKNDFYKI
mgnify:FL=1